MIDKIKTLLTIILIVIVVFALGYSLVKTIIAAFEQPVLVTVDNLKEYTVQENIIVSYSTFYYYEDCMNNFIEACEKEKYDELYDIYLSDYKKDNSKENIVSELKKIKELITPKDIDEIIRYDLKNLYLAVNETYIAEIVVNKSSMSNSTVFYIIFGLSNDKELDYNFAIVK